MPLTPALLFTEETARMDTYRLQSHAHLFVPDDPIAQRHMHRFVPHGSISLCACGAYITPATSDVASLEARVRDLDAPRVPEADAS